MKTSAEEPVVLLALPGGGAAAFANSEVIRAKRRAQELGFGPPVPADNVPQGPERLLNSRELAELIGVGDTTIEGMAARGAIPAIRIGRALRFEPSKVIAALQNTRK